MFWNTNVFRGKASGASPVVFDPSKPYTVQSTSIVLPQPGHERPQKKDDWTNRDSVNPDTKDECFQVFAEREECFAVTTESDACFTLDIYSQSDPNNPFKQVASPYPPFPGNIDMASWGFSNLYLIHCQASLFVVGLYNEYDAGGTVIDSYIALASFNFTRSSSGGVGIIDSMNSIKRLTDYGFSGTADDLFMLQGVDCSNNYDIVFKSKTEIYLISSISLSLQAVHSVTYSQMDAYYLTRSLIPSGKHTNINIYVAGTYACQDGTTHDKYYSYGFDTSGGESGTQYLSDMRRWLDGFALMGQVICKTVSETVYPYYSSCRISYGDECTIDSNTTYMYDEWITDGVNIYSIENVAPNYKNNNASYIARNSLTVGALNTFTPVPGGAFNDASAYSGVFMSVSAADAVVTQTVV